jgi:hypothetical protein
MVDLRDNSGRPRVPLSEQALEDVRFLRAAVESNIRVTALSPGGLLVAGIAGLGAAGASVVLPAERPAFAWGPTPVSIFLAIWLGALLLSMVAGLTGMRLRSQRQGEQFRSTALRRMLLSMTAPLAAGGVVTLWALWQAQPPWVLATVWTGFYGLTLVSAAAYTIGAVRVFGWSVLALAAGLLAAGPGAGMGWVASALGLAFGAGHLLLAVHVGGRYGW